MICSFTTDTERQEMLLRGNSAPKSRLARNDISSVDFVHVDAADAAYAANAVDVADASYAGNAVGAADAAYAANAVDAADAAYAANTVDAADAADAANAADAVEAKDAADVENRTLLLLLVLLVLLPLFLRVNATSVSFLPMFDLFRAVSASLNTAVYTIISLAGCWAGAVMSWAGAILIWAGASSNNGSFKKKCIMI